MRKILVTGGTGFIGRNVLPILREQKGYEIVAPTRKELNLKDEFEIVNFLKENQISIVLHLANPTPGKNHLDSIDTLAEDSLRIFLNFYNHSTLFEKMIYVGSGAEYDKSKNIDFINEEENGRSIPKDPYGFSKFIMNQMADRSEKIYNFRVFGCYGPGDHESKFITHCIRSVLLGKDITIRKDCYFDYLHVYDFAKYLLWGIDNELKYHSYNVGSGCQIKLSEIAEIVIEEMKSSVSVTLLSKEKNNNYTSCCGRIQKECGFKPDITLREGIKMQIKWEKENWSVDTPFDGI